MEINLNFLDRAIGFINPGAGLKRAQDRAMSNILMDNVRMYDAAGRGRRTKGWHATGTSANKETERSLTLLRWRARELVRNNAYAKRAIQAISTNTTGLGIRATPVEGDGKRQNKAVKEAWKSWAESLDCDYDGQANFYGIQRLAMRCIAESGEVLLRRRWVTDKDIPVQIQVLEPDFLDHMKNSVMRKDGSYIIQGVQFNKDGKREGYWLYPFHPGDNSFTLMSEFVPATEVLHVYYKERAGQVRGVPFGASTAVSLYDFDEYEQAQLVRQKIAACFAIFVQDSDADITRPTNASVGKNREKVEPGIIEHLPQGKTMTFATPPGVQNYDEYASAMLRKIAVGFGVSYEILSGDLSNVNFSSGRMGWIEFHRLISEWQSLMLIPMMCDPIFAWFVEAAAIMGKATIGQKASWTPPRREMIDPVKETKALSEQVRNGFESWSNAVRQGGQDPSQVLDEIIKDYAAFDKAELMLACDPRYDAGRKIPPDQELPGGGETPENDDETTPKQVKTQLKNSKK